MNSYNQNWQEEDFELAEEFQLLQIQIEQHIATPPPVPSHLDRLVKKHAAYKVSHQFTSSFLLSPAIQLLLVALLLGAIGIGFLISMQPPSKNTDLNLHSESVGLSWKSPTDTSLSKSWLLLQFNVDGSGKASNPVILRNCIQQKQGSCASSTIYNQAAREHITSKFYQNAGIHRRLVWVTDKHARTKINQKHLKQ